MAVVLNKRRFTWRMEGYERNRGSCSAFGWLRGGKGEKRMVSRVRHSNGKGGRIREGPSQSDRFSTHAEEDIAG